MPEYSREVSHILRRVAIAYRFALWGPTAIKDEATRKAFLEGKFARISECQAMIATLVGSRKIANDLVVQTMLQVRRSHNGQTHAAR
jgi:hypothetical protein